MGRCWDSELEDLKRFLALPHKAQGPSDGPNGQGNGPISRVEILKGGGSFIFVALGL